MKRKQYNTAGRSALDTFLQAHPDRQFTVEELCSEINESTPVGKSSIYRHLTQLCQTNTVRIFRSEEKQCNLYQYVGDACNCREHFHEKCVKCGRIEHLDCHISTDFINHLQAEHGFSVDCGQSILYGVCAECRKAGGHFHA